MDEKLEIVLKEVIEKLEGRDIDQDILRNELSELLKYGVPSDQAKQRIIQKYTGNAAAIETEAPQKLIRDLEGNEGRVNLLCRVISVNERRTTIDGNERVSYYGLLEDESGVVGFTAWQDFDIKVDDTLQIKNAYTKLWQNRVRVNLGSYASIQKVDSSVLPKGEIKQFKIITLEPKEVRARDEIKEIWTGTIGDETGRIDFSAWHDFQLKIGESIKISGGWTRSWRNMTQLSFDERADVERVSQDIIPVETKDENLKLSLEDLNERGGGSDIEVKGTIIDIKEGSGLVFRCPQCKRVLKNNLCGIHGQVEGVPDLRIKAIVDDGTFAITAILGKELTQKLIGRTLEECQNLAQQAMDYKVIEKEIGAKLLMENMELRGNAIKDDWGVTFIAKDAKSMEINLAEELEKIEREEAS
jgi:replication factor A1